MSEAERMLDEDIRVWSFDEAQGRSKREYIKSYYHILDDALAFHTHDFYEINIVSGGAGKHRIEDREIIAQKGDIFIIPPNVGHGYSCKDKMTVYHILLSNGFMTAFAPFFEKLPGYDMLFNIEPMLRSRLQRAYYLRSDRISFDTVKQHISMIEGGKDEKIPGNDTETAFHVLSLIAALSKRMYLLGSFNDPEIANDRVLTIIESMEYIERHCGEKLNYKDVAAKCAISYSTYLRTFKRLSGVTPAEYQMNCRIRSAADLLKNSDESVLSVALSCGFYDSSHFIREFTKRKGLTPSEFRKA